MCSTYCIAQNKIFVNIKDESDTPVQFYTLQSVKDAKNVYMADSLGNASIPFVIGQTYKIHAVGFPDTLITVHNNTELRIKLKSNNQLNEVLIKPITYSKTLDNFKSSRTNEFNWYGSGNSTYNHEIGRIVSFDKKIWIQNISFKVKSKNDVNLKKDLFVNIYKINDNLQIEIDALIKKKPGYYKFSSPDIVFSSHLSDNYSISFKNNLLTFDLSKQGVYLEEGNYIVVLELMALTTKEIMPYFSLSKDCFTLRSNNNSKIVTWFTDLWEKKYMNIITDISYFPRQ